MTIHYPSDERGVTLPLLLDPTHSVREAVGAQKSFVVDRAGDVRWSHIGTQIRGLPIAGRRASRAGLSLTPAPEQTEDEHRREHAGEDRPAQPGDR